MENNKFLTKRTWAALAAGLLIVLTVSAAAESREFRFAVSGSGSATAPDREEAVEEAHQNAKEQARAICAGGNGFTGHIERTGTSCTALGDGDNQRYSCLVFVRAECISRVR